jgi:uncharacterized protein DUF4276
VKVRIYVEGGPKGADVDGVRNFRNAFKQHFQQLDQGLKTMDVISYGSTEQTVKSYAQGVRLYSPDCAVALLVDADAPVTANSAAGHLADKLDLASVPANARKNIFLMVQCMESWLVTDAAALRGCFGQKLRANILPPNLDIEAVSKKDVFAALDAAVKPTPTKRYHKVEHGAKILAKLKPGLVGKRSRHAKSLYAFLLNSLQS